jgi:hypothetical protein
MVFNHHVFVISPPVVTGAILLQDIEKGLQVYGTVITAI